MGWNVAGAFVVKKGQEFLKWVDGILDTVARVGAVAAAATVGAAIAALSGAVALGASLAVIRAALTPFMGPFAWLLGTVLEIGVDIIDFFIDLKGKLTDFTEWLVKQALATVESFIRVVLK